MNTITGTIIKVSGPLVVAKNMHGAKMFDVVRVAEQKLVGEIIELKNDKASIQVYEETSGIGPGEKVVSTGEPLSVELGPGIMENFYDGVQRPLKAIEKISGAFIARGIDVPGIDRAKQWKFKPVVKEGALVHGGDIIGEVDETVLIKHKIMVPPLLSGTIESIQEGSFSVEDTVAVLKGEDGKKHNLQMMQRWPIRIPRPTKRKMIPEIPLITGQRVIDTFFPIVTGGAGSVPGPFGSGKTVVQHQLAKWSSADVVVYVGCGERGNEMTDVLVEFPELIDPRSGEPLMKRTILIANTSNMPVAAREASVYTGITIGEYFRDMGYNVAMMADSTSRWAEAMREMSGRLEEMPGEEGYPAYLGSRTAQFYERAGHVKCLGKDDREGSLTVIGAVSPPGGDLSEPVTQNTLRVTKVFWALDYALSYKRHFPAINWLNSYSLYSPSVRNYMDEHAGEGFSDMRDKSMALLQQEAALEEIVKLVGLESLSKKEQIVLITTRMIREDFLQQNAFDDVDAYTDLTKQFFMLRAILTFLEAANEVVEKNTELEIKDIQGLKVIEKIARMKSIKQDDVAEIEKLSSEIQKELHSLVATQVVA